MHNSTKFYPNYKLKNNVVLVGMMGCGKSTLGKILASSLKVDFVDSDREIEISAGKSVTDIFAEDGEDFFRSGESKVMKRLLTDNKPKIVASGGGAFINHETRRIIQNNSISIWIRSSKKVLLERLKDTENRPLLLKDSLEKTITTMIKERYQYYIQANITIESKSSKQDTIDKIIESLQKY